MEGEFNALDYFHRQQAIRGVLLISMVVLLLITLVGVVGTMSDAYHPAPDSEPTTMRDFRVLYEADEYHEDFGDVLWWRLPINEPPHVGSPLDDDFPVDGYYTHWSKLVIPDQFPYEN